MVQYKTLTHKTLKLQLPKKNPQKNMKEKLKPYWLGKNGEVILMIYFTVLLATSVALTRFFPNFLCIAGC